MMDAPRDQVPSDRLQLELALLGADAIAPAEDPAQPSGERHTVLVAVAEDDMRDYIARCLRERPELRVVETTPRTTLLEAVRHASADLLVCDLSLIADSHALLGGTPLLLIGDELPDPFPASSESRTAVLLQPFNARRLVDAVLRLLAAPASRPIDVHPV
jgi:hypothetical protein